MKEKKERKKERKYTIRKNKEKIKKSCKINKK